jgi:hypothetical protein
VLGISLVVPAVYEVFLRPHSLTLPEAALVTEPAVLQEGRMAWPHRYRLLSRERNRILKIKEVGIPVQPGDVFVIESAVEAGKNRVGAAANLSGGFTPMLPAGAGRVAIL